MATIAGIPRKLAQQKRWLVAEHGVMGLDFSI